MSDVKRYGCNGMECGMKITNPRTFVMERLPRTGREFSALCRARCYGRAVLHGLATCAACLIYPFASIGVALANYHARKYDA